MANYQTVKDGIANRLNGLGYAESSQAIDFANAPASEYGNRYIINALTGVNQNDQILSSFDDTQEWQILIAFERSEQNDIIQKDAAHRGKDAIIKDLDKPANWESFVKLLKYDRWEFIEVTNYFVIDIRLSVMDLYNHG